MKNIEQYNFLSETVKIMYEKGVWELTPHGQSLGNGMAEIDNLCTEKDVIEIGTGSGVHAILALKLGAKNIDVSDIDEASLKITKENAILNMVNIRNFFLENWMSFEPIKKYDLLLCNPPFCKAPNGKRRYFINELIQKCHLFIKDQGTFIFTQSSMANFKLTEKALQKAGFSFNVVHQSKHIFRDYYYTEQGFIEEINKVTSGYEVINGKDVETLRTYLCLRNAI